MRAERVSRGRRSEEDSDGKTHADDREMRRELQQLLQQPPLAPPRRRSSPPSPRLMWGPPQGSGPAMTGTIRQYIKHKGFGFITCDNPGEEDVFTHFSYIIDACLLYTSPSPRDS